MVRRVILSDYIPWNFQEYIFNTTGTTADVYTSEFTSALGHAMQVADHYYRDKAFKDQLVRSLANVVIWTAVMAAGSEIDATDFEHAVTAEMLDYVLERSNGDAKNP